MDLFGSSAAKYKKRDAIIATSLIYGCLSNNSAADQVKLVYNLRGRRKTRVLNALAVLSADIIRLHFFDTDISYEKALHTYGLQVVNMEETHPLEITTPLKEAVMLLTAAADPDLLNIAAHTAGRPAAAAMAEFAAAYLRELGETKDVDPKELLQNFAREL